MIDTVKVSYRREISDQWVRTWPHYERHGKKETFEMDITSQDGKRIHTTYHTHNYKGKFDPLLLFRFSAPKLVYECNHTLISTLEESISKANSIIHRLQDFSGIRIEDGILSRIDLCCHHNVGVLVPDYLRVLKNGTLPHRITFLYPKGGVEFRAGNIKSLFYPKLTECQHNVMEGVIRQEEQIKNKGRIEDLLKVRNPTLLDVNKDFAIQVLENTLSRLRLDQSIITNFDEASEILVREHGRTRGNNLYRFWVLRQTWNKKDLQTIYKYSPENMNIMERMITKSGIAMLSSKVPLPTLKVEL